MTFMIKNRIEEKDYLDYDSNELITLRKEISKIVNLPKYIYVFIATLSIFITSLFLINFFYSAVNSTVPNDTLRNMMIINGFLYFCISENHIKSISNFIYMKLSKFKKLNYLMHSLFNSKNENMKIFFVKFLRTDSSSLFDTNDLYDFIQNIDNKNISIENIDFFSEIDEEIMNYREKIIEREDRYNRYTKIDDIANKKLNSENNKINLEKEFNFTK